MKIYYCLFSLLLLQMFVLNLAVCAHDSGTTCTSNSTFTQSTTEILSVFNNLPNWGVEPDKQDNVTTHIAAAKRILAKKTTAQLRFALSQRLKGQVSPEDSGRAYLFNRIVFKVSGTAQANREPRFASWIRLPSDRSNRSTLWPFEEDGEVLYLTGTHYGYSGPPYDALKEFDYFARRYERRK